MIDTIIDVNHDNTLDLKAVNDAGIVAIIHKASEGGTFTDPLYHERKEAALKAGFLWGAYHFSSGVSVSTQVNNFLSMEDGTDPRILLALDWEDSTSGANMTLENARAFVTKIKEKTGRFPCLYGGNLIRENVTDKDTVLANCPLWYIRLMDNPKGIPTHTWPKFTLWQYTDGKSGQEPRKTPGSDGADRNRFDGTDADLRTKWPFTKVPVPPKPVVPAK